MLGITENKNSLQVQVQFTLNACLNKFFLNLLQSASERISTGKLSLISFRWLLTERLLQNSQIWPINNQQHNTGPQFRVFS